ncbi:MULTISPECIES: SIMPL domain-containing protein [Bacillaceae]|uniref:SIMPL domain-containing protein n=1 Tax=Bacillaceae TaxID=186817 RepID=UPI000BA41B37|nr:MULTISPECIES: SIMPL domain-containing protein [Bacillaceae]MCM3055853.1 SIMPL domain-containing protein [Caldibacillus thermoamylovorans]PAC37101.1 SIMPL domain-containing protein [Caldifermentibacillus hisashii]
MVYYRNGLPMRNANVLTVFGEGKVHVEPNLAFITIGIVRENKNLQTAQAENSVASNNVIQALLALGINPNHIRTVEYRIDNVYDFVDGKQIFRAYEVRHLLEVQVENIGQIGLVVDTAVAQGANIIFNIRFDTSNRSAKYHEALTLALSDAHAKARTITNGLGVVFQPIPIEITETRQGVAPAPYQTFTLEKVAGASTPIEPGTLQIEASLIAKFLY